MRGRLFWPLVQLAYESGRITINCYGWTFNDQLAVAVAAVAAPAAFPSLFSVAFSSEGVRQKGAC